jgi:hypothetical protein
MQECQETVFDCGLLGFMNTRDATLLRSCNRCAKAAVGQHAWADMETRIRHVRHWRACFPLATRANLSHHASLAHYEFKYLEKITHLDLSYCESYSFINDSFRYLQELRHLDMSHSWQDPTVWAFFREAFDDSLFRYLGKLETLKLDGYGISQFDGEFINYLPKLRTLYLRNWSPGPANCRTFFKNMKANVYTTHESWVFNHWNEMPRQGFYITG